MSHPLFPPQFLAAGISLEHIGVANLAWRREDALSIIEALHGTGVAVLGGDVLDTAEGHLAYNYSNWHIEPQPHELWPAFVGRSHRLATEYIAAYRQPDNSAYAFTLVLTDVPVSSAASPS